MTRGQTPSASPTTTASACSQRLVGGERGVEPADHDRLAPAAELVGDLVGPRRLVRHAGQADEVARLVEVDRPRTGRP